MNRMWEIREHDGYGKMGHRSEHRSPEEDAYECGFEDGYREAMIEAKSYYGERGSMSSYRKSMGGR